MTRRPPPERRDGIGASEVPAIAGASPWATPVGVWLEKVGLAAGPDESPAMRAGKGLEWPLMRLGAQELGQRLTHNAQRFRHPDWADVPLYATPDAFGPGRRSIAEVKLVGHRAGDWSDGPPEYVGLQVQAQLACLPGADVAFVVALLGSELRTWRIERDDLTQQRLPILVGEWWRRFVVGGIAPPASGPNDEWALLRARAAPSGRPERLAAPDEMGLGADLLAALALRDDLETKIDAGRRTLAERATESDVVGVGWVARWGQRKTVDWRALATAAGALPDQIAAHTRATPAFTFRRLAGDGDE